MPIRRSTTGDSQTRSHSRQQAQISTLPTIGVMRECFREYLELNVANGSASADTIKTYLSRLKQYLSWCTEKELYPALATQQQIIQYRKYLIKEGKSCPTIRLSLIAIKQFYKACLIKKLVKTNPALEVKPPRDKRGVSSTINYLSEEELQQLLDSVPANVMKIRDDKIKQIQQYRDLILLACMGLQGCRTIELHRANWGNITECQGELYLTVDGKNSIRNILLRQDLAAKIILYRQAREDNQEKITAKSPFLISLCNRHYKQRLSRQGISQIVSRYLKICNLQNKNLSGNVSPHSLRHTAGTLSLQNGSELREVQDLLGHADPKTTAIYTHLISSQEHNPAGKIKVHL